MLMLTKEMCSVTTTLAVMNDFVDKVVDAKDDDECIELIKYHVNMMNMLLEMIKNRA